MSVCGCVCVVYKTQTGTHGRHRFNIAGSALMTFSFDAPEVLRFIDICAMRTGRSKTHITAELDTAVAQMHKSTHWPHTRSDAARRGVILKKLIKNVSRLIQRLPTDDCLSDSAEMLGYIRRTLELDDIDISTGRKHFLFQTPDPLKLSLYNTRIMVHGGFKLDTALDSIGHPDNRAHSGDDDRSKEATETDCPGGADGNTWAACDIIGAVLKLFDFLCDPDLRPEILDNGDEMVRLFDSDLAGLLADVLTVRPDMPWTRCGRQPLGGVAKMLHHTAVPMESHIAWLLPYNARLLDSSEEASHSVPRTREFVQRHYPTALRLPGASTKRAGKRLRPVTDAPDQKRVRTAESESGDGTAS